MDRAGGMENAYETLVVVCTGVESRFPHRLGRHRTPPTGSTGQIVVLFEHDVTGRTRAPVAKRMGGNRPTNVAALRRAFTFAGIRVHVPRIRRSTSPECAESRTGSQPAARSNRATGGHSEFAARERVPHRTPQKRRLPGVTRRPCLRRVVGEAAAPAAGLLTQTGAQLVAPRADGLDRHDRLKADLALNAVDLDGGGQAVAAHVDLSNKADSASRLGTRAIALRCHVPRRGITPRRAGCPARRRNRCRGRFVSCGIRGWRRLVTLADGGTHRLTPPTNVRAAHVTSPMSAAAGGQGRVGQTCLLGLSLTSCQVPDPSRPARLTTRPSSVRTT